MTNPTHDRAAAGLSVGQCAAVGGLIAALFVFWGLARPPLHAWDEAWYAKVALEMLRRGEWWVTYNDGVPDPTLLRPPLCLWATAAAFALLGPTELAARLFSATCYVALVACVAAFCRRRFTTRVALTAAFLLSADRVLLFKHGARSGDTDAPLMLFLTLTAFGACALRERGGGAWRVWAAYAAALLTKGVAALQVLPPLLLWFALLRARRAGVRFAAAAALAGLPLAGWLAIREWRQLGFSAAMLRQDVLGRVAAHADHADPPAHSYLLTFAKSAAPAALAITIVAAALRGRPGLADQLRDASQRAALLRLLALWWLVPTVMFALARTHRDWYLYPSYVPAYILAAWVLGAGLDRLERAGRRRVAALAGAVVLLGAGLPSAWKVIHHPRSDRQRVAETQRLIEIVRQAHPPPTLVVYRPDPALRFNLYRAGVAYTYVFEPAALPRAVDAQPAPVWLACSVFDRDVVERWLARRSLTPLARMPLCGVELLACEAASSDGPAGP